jgi:hypothetical protein
MGAIVFIIVLSALWGIGNLLNNIVEAIINFRKEPK